MEGRSGSASVFKSEPACLGLGRSVCTTLCVFSICGDSFHAQMVGVGNFQFIVILLFPMYISFSISDSPPVDRLRHLKCYQNSFEID